MNSKLFTYTTTILITAFIAGSSVSFASNNKIEKIEHKKYAMTAGSKTGTGMKNTHRKTKKINVSIEDTSGGVIISRTSKDEKAISHLLKEANREKSITRNISNTNSGTIETIVSTSTVVVDDLQKQTNSIQKKVDRMKHKKSVDISIVNVSGGIQITTITSNDKMLKALHEKATEQNAITREITLLANGVRTSLSSKDRDVVEVYSGMKSGKIKREE